LGVTNDKGHLVDTLSVRDLRGIGVKAEHFERLWHSVKAYKDEVRKEFHRQTPPQPIHVTEDDTLEAVIRAMDDGNIHRVFVVQKVEGGLRPTFVITQRDVLRFLLFKLGLEPIWEVEPLP
jgi:CBS domain-containing protein